MPDFGLQQGDPGSLSFPNQIGYFLCFTNPPPPPRLPRQLQICQELCTSRMAFCVCEAESLGERAHVALSKTLAYLTGSLHHSSWISALQRSSRRKVSRRDRGEGRNVPGWSDSEGSILVALSSTCALQAAWDPSALWRLLRSSASVTLAGISVYSRRRGSKCCRPVANRKVSITIRLSGQRCSEVRPPALSLLVLSGRADLDRRTKKEKKIPFMQQRRRGAFGSGCRAWWKEMSEGKAEFHGSFNTFQGCLQFVSPRQSRRHSPMAHAGAQLLVFLCFLFLPYS